MIVRGVDPSPAKSLIDLNIGKEAIALCLFVRNESAEKLPFRIEVGQVIGLPFLVAKIR